jgi:hypothetical protein
MHSIILRDPGVALISQVVAFAVMKRIVVKGLGA